MKVKSFLKKKLAERSTKIKSKAIVNVIDSKE